MSELKASSNLEAPTGGPLGIPERVYFRLKPYIPKKLRFFLRRTRVPGIMRRSGDVWPIDPKSGQAPSDWKGWPLGKQFALVFTHDVEDKEGLRKTKALAELEIEYGFRSSFNFVPEGVYENPPTLRKWLVESGFEVGVHDLNHDGFLYDSREGFSKKAQSINSYLEQWGAVGFRAGFMFSQLDWLHDLNVLYDTSTFDTDPFEPQPDGTGTIFPFHVEAPRGTDRPGYVELSYTLPQDSTLFLLLKEKTTDTWKRKLDWIAQQGGLALVNIHPDYIDFSGPGDTGSTYPVSLLEEFLKYIRTEYEGSYWNPLARDLASWFQDPSSDTFVYSNNLHNPPTPPNPLLS